MKSFQERRAESAAALQAGKERRAAIKENAQAKNVERHERFEAKRDAKKTDRAGKTDRAADSFKDIAIVGDRVECGEDGGPLAGASARVETAGEIDRRVSGTRLVLMGPLALLAKKKVDHRELYLTIEGAGFSIVKQLDPDRDGLAARQFAARVNAKATQIPH